MPARRLGLEEARRTLPQLASRAHAGEATLLTRHGKAYAAIVSPDALQAARAPRLFLKLRASGAGLWGEVPGQAVADLRGQWD